MTKLDKLLYQDALESGKTDPCMRLFARAFELRQLGDNAKADRYCAIASSFIDAQEKQLFLELSKEIVTKPS